MLGAGFVLVVFLRIEIPGQISGDDSTKCHSDPKAPAHDALSSGFAQLRIYEGRYKKCEETDDEADHCRGAAPNEESA